MLAGYGWRPSVTLVLLGQLPGMATRTPPQLLKSGLWVRPVPPVPASEQDQVALALGLGVLLEDLRVVRVEYPTRRRLPRATARIALDPRYQATGSAKGILLRRRGLQVRRLAV